MVEIEIYTTPMCGYCRRAKSLFDEKGVEYQEINLGEEPERKQEMIERSNGKQTVPQIFIDDQHIGGCDELLALDETGSLDELLFEREESS